MLNGCVSAKKTVSLFQKRKRRRRGLGPVGRAASPVGGSESDARTTGAKWEHTFCSTISLTSGGLDDKPNNLIDGNLFCTQTLSWA